MTAFASIASSIKTLLSASTPVAQLIAHARRRPVPDDVETAVQVSVLRSDGALFAIRGGPTDWTTEVLVECYARDRAGQGADAAVDALVAAVYARLATDRTLGGLVGDINPTALEFDYDAAGESLACVVLTLSVLHRTANQTLE